MTDYPGAGPSPSEPGTPEPAASPPPQPAGTPGGGSGLPENVAGALCYLLGALTGIVFFIIDRERAFVRFHAVQAIGITIAWIALSIVLSIVGMVLGFIPVLGWILGLLLSLGLGLGGFALWLWLMYQAYQGRSWEVPVLGPHVRKLAAETGGRAA